MTINRRLAALHTFFEFLAAEEPDREWPNPVIWRRHGIKRGAHLPRNASDKDVERLFAAMDDVRNRAIFSLMVGVGLRELLRAYLTRRWRNWQPHMARQNGQSLASQLGRAWEWLLKSRELSGWSDLQRSDLEAWLSARREAGIAVSTRISELEVMKSFLRFVVDQDISLSANLFRVSCPPRPEPLPATSVRASMAV